MPMPIQIEDVLRRHERNVRKVKKTTKELTKDFGEILNQFAEEHNISHTEIIDLMLVELREMHFAEIRRTELNTHMKGR
jgi:hypothetical protein